MKIYFEQENVIAGITLREPIKKEANNMALHACKDKTVIIENREQLAHSLHVRLEDFVCAEQTHSANIYEVTANDRGRGAKELTTAIKNTDALYTTEENIILTTFTADCVPVFFYHKEAGVVGVIHSGWRGTVQEITPKTLTQVLEQFQTVASGFHVQIGMALSKRRFEVDEDVFKQFQALGYAEPFMSYKSETHKYHIDNQRVVIEQCKRIGIPSEQISVDRTCTFESESGFSYRQDRQAGRHLGFIMKK